MTRFFGGVLALTLLACARGGVAQPPRSLTPSRVAAAPAPSFSPPSSRLRGRHTVRFGIGTRLSRDSVPLSATVTYLFDVLQSTHLALFLGANSSLGRHGVGDFYWQTSAEVGARLMFPDQRISLELAYAPIAAAFDDVLLPPDPFGARLGIGKHWEIPGIMFQTRMQRLGRDTHVDFELLLEFSI